MYIRHHTNCSVESVVERGEPIPTLSSVCGRGRQVVKTSTYVCLSSASRLGDTVHDGLEVWFSETLTDQYIVYNIKNGVV